MTLVKLEIPGGAVADRPEYSTGARWKTTEKVRFQQGLPEKIGGWTNESGWSFTGVASDILAWRTLNGDSIIAVGTEKKLEVVYNDTKTDVTPVRSTATLNGPFTTSSGSATVTVAHTAHGALDGDYVVFSGASAGGGITVDGEYQLTHVDDNTYTITHGSNASSSASSTGGSSVSTTYLLSGGRAQASEGLGWGAGGWGDPREGATKTEDTITGITQANPGVVTAGSHPFVNGDLVKITGVVGMTQVNGNTYTVANKATNTFELSGTNTSGFGSYSSGGTATKQFGWGYSANADQSDVTLEPSTWSLSLWGEDMIATRRNEATYLWDATNPTTRVTVVTNAPTSTKLTLVATPSRHVVALGAHTGSVADPLNVRWSDQEGLTTWTSAADNTAGSQRLQGGSKIVAGLQTRGQILIWTDDTLQAMNYIGPPYIFGFTIIASNCSPISQKSVVDQNGIVYWMGNKHFYVYDGSVKILPSPVRDQVFDNMDSSLDQLTYGGLNRRFNEIWWFYTTTGSTSPNKYVVYNHSTAEWHFGTLDRCVWLDEVSWLNNPVAVQSDGTLSYHESGTSDNGSAFSSYIETGVFEIPQAGDDLFIADKLIPDATITGNAKLTFYTKKYPAGSEVTKGPFTLSSSTQKLSMRARGRQIRMRIESDGASDFWKWGTPRLRYRRSGKR